MKEYTFLKFQVTKGVGIITLNRPEVYNALNDEITFELQDALKFCTKDSSVRVVVLTGEGKAFCSGQDLKDSSKNPDRSFSKSLHKRYNPIINAIRNMPKPVICSLNGVAAGAGCSLVLACDYTIASENATLIEVFINIGLVLDSGSSWFLPRLISYNKAFEISTLGSKIDASTAHEMGMINTVVPHDELENATQEIANRYAQAPTKAIGLIKKMLNQAYTKNLKESLEYEAYAQEIAGSSNDHKEGVNAFLEKRKPEFKGN